ncbi:NfuA family Fe-S biogenesis protein [soil metagenome]
MIQISDAARDQIRSLMDTQVVRDPALRVTLAAAPQAGYQISLVERDDKGRTEIAINVDGIRVFLNLDTSTLLSGAVIDHADGGFRVDTPRPEPTARSSSGPATIDHPLAERLRQVIDEEVNPRIAAHGGAVELADIEDNTLYLRMSGGCQGCAASAATLRQGIERMVREAVPEIQEIVDVTDHASGVNPYY